MKYSEIAVKIMLKVDDLSLEELIKFHILNFIRVIHLNELDFIESSFGYQPLEDLIKLAGE